MGRIVLDAEISRLALDVYPETQESLLIERRSVAVNLCAAGT